MSLKALFVEDLDSNRDRFQSNPHILIYIPFVHRSKPAFTKDVIIAEALRDGLKFKQSEGNHISI